MMKFRIITISLLLILMVISVAGQERYDLSRCISTSLENNYSLTIARNREAITDNNYSRGNAGYLPTLDLSGRYGGTINSTEQRLAAGGINTSDGVHNSTTTAGVSLGWSIFRGFSVQTTYKKLGELRSIGELNTQISVENLVARLIAEYYFLIQQQQLYKNLEFAVSLSGERVRIDEERYLIGAGSKLQLLQSKVYFNSDSSRLARQNEVLRSSEIRINELMAVDDLAQSIIITDTVMTIDPGLVYEILLSETMEANTSLQLARKNLTISEYDYKIITARSYPYLTLSSGYNSTLNMYQTGTYTSQLTNGANYGVTMGVNIFDGYNKRLDRRNAILEIENKDLLYRQVEQEVRADLITIHSAYTNNLRLLQLEEENLKTAEENLEIAFERYKLGNLSGLDLREVQKSLLDAEERLLSVQYQTKTAEITLLQISGRVMDYMN